MTKIFTEAENQEWSKTLPGKMCSACLVIIQNEKALMVKAGYKDHWTFPSGIVDSNESPKSAAIRETIEEVGLEIDASTVDLLTVIYTSAKKEHDRDRFNFAFITHLAIKDFQLTIPNDEIDSVEWVAFDQVASKANDKLSYIELQKILLNQSGNTPYTEV